jgi:hypothetical protein
MIVDESLVENKGLENKDFVIARNRIKFEN